MDALIDSQLRAVELNWRCGEDIADQSMYHRVPVQRYEGNDVMFVIC